MADELQQRRTGGAEQARLRFAEASRSASFNLSLGIREVRMIGNNDWRLVSSWMPQELGTLQRLIDKGLVEHEEGQSPKLSEAGMLMRHMLILSGHLRYNEHPDKLEPSDLLDIMNHGLQWYRDGNHWLDGVRIQRGHKAELDELRITTVKPDTTVNINEYEPREVLRRPLIRQEFRIKRSAIEEVG